MAGKRNTKQNILDVALEMFSKDGYEAVSIRDICGAVGIKESTVYYHFKNKEDILRKLTEDYTITIEKLNQFVSSGMLSTDWKMMNDYIFLRTAVVYFSQFLGKEKIRQFLKLLQIEQHRNKELAVLYSRLLMEDPIARQGEYFSLLMEIGYLRELPIEELATAYQAIFFFVFCRQLATDLPQKEAEADLERQLKFFLEQYKL